MLTLHFTVMVLGWFAFSWFAYYSGFSVWVRKSLVLGFAAALSFGGLSYMYNLTDGPVTAKYMVGWGIHAFFLLFVLRTLIDMAKGRVMQFWLTFFTLASGTGFASFLIWYYYN